MIKVMSSVVVHLLDVYLLFLGLTKQVLAEEIGHLPALFFSQPAPGNHHSTSCLYEFDYFQFSSVQSLSRVRLFATP